jgi:hypothetical protein
VQLVLQEALLRQGLARSHLQQQVRLLQQVQQLLR